MSFERNAIIFETLSTKMQNFVPGVKPPFHESIISKDYRPITLTVGIASSLHEEIRYWCEDQFGNNWIWAFERFYFRYRSDEMLFRLIWGEYIVPSNKE